MRIDHLWTDLQRNFFLCIVSSRQSVKWGCTKFKLDCGMTCPEWPDQVCRVVVLVLTSCRMLSSRISFSHPCTLGCACACAFPHFALDWNKERAKQSLGRKYDCWRTNNIMWQLDTVVPPSKYALFEQKPKKHNRTTRPPKLGGVGWLTLCPVEFRQCL